MKGQAKDYGSTSKAFTKRLASPLVITVSLKTLMVDNP